MRICIQNMRISIQIMRVCIQNMRISIQIMRICIQNKKFQANSMKHRNKQLKRLGLKLVKHTIIPKKTK